MNVHAQPPSDILKIILFIALIMIAFLSFSQKVLLPGEKYLSPDTSVVMSFDEYTTYYVAKKSFDSLSVRIPIYVAETNDLITVLQSQNTTLKLLATGHKQIIERYATVQSEQRKEIRHLQWQNAKYKIKTTVLSATTIIVPAVILMILL
jgi:hypothetical protein